MPIMILSQDVVELINDAIASQLRLTLPTHQRIMVALKINNLTALALVFVPVLLLSSWAVAIPIMGGPHSPNTHGYAGVNARKVDLYYEGFPPGDHTKVAREALPEPEAKGAVLKQI
ncbi:hypothetical protein CPB83DRAFT_855742 [Crepidotus variabilis]|uniref:Uncharacterized protein n=1 Tax=Crepidotus variabilis TaxID=179855 RepID=A0A9P6JPJ2_9AGAR|nr:hypothetical protein CPB83DRAFT_855742 [Crepidotus variabilis]